MITALSALKNLLKHSGPGLAVVAAFALGWYSHVAETKIKEVVVTKVQQVDHVVTKTVKVVDRPKAGGSRVTTTTESTATVATRASEAAQATATVPQPSQNWSLGLRWKYGAYNPTGVSLGRRVIGPVWGEVGYDLDKRAPLLGVRVDF